MPSLFPIIGVVLHGVCNAFSNCKVGNGVFVIVKVRSIFSLPADLDQCHTNCNLVWLDWITQICTPEFGNPLVVCNWMPIIETSRMNSLDDIIK